jgi:sulfur-oxidizing protein SoxY
MSPPTDLDLERRRLLRAAGGAALVVALRPARGDAPPELDAAIRAFADGAPVQAGRIALEVAPLVENGNAVPVTVSVQSPMTEAEHVREIAIFNEKNPQRDVIVCHLGPRAGRARVGTRIRLATSQRLVALARLSDGSVWQDAVDVIVTLAACVES